VGFASLHLIRTLDGDPASYDCESGYEPATPNVTLVLRCLSFANRYDWYWDTAPQVPVCRRLGMYASCKPRKFSKALPLLPVGLEVQQHLYSRVTFVEVTSVIHTAQASVAPSSSSITKVRIA